MATPRSVLQPEAAVVNLGDEWWRWLGVLIAGTSVRTSKRRGNRTAAGEWNGGGNNCLFKRSCVARSGLEPWSSSPAVPALSVQLWGSGGTSGAHSGPHPSCQVDFSPNGLSLLSDIFYAVFVLFSSCSCLCVVAFCTFVCWALRLHEFPSLVRIYISLCQFSFSFCFLFSFFATVPHRAHAWVEGGVTR